MLELRDAYSHKYVHQRPVMSFGSVVLLKNSVSKLIL